METSKSHARRMAEGWFARYAPEDKSGIDIGCQYDRVNNTFQPHDWAFGHSDAHTMEDRADESYFTVYASHVLEHLADPILGLKNWWRILQPGGHMILVLPHRDLYEKRISLPSNGNPDHKTFWLPWHSEPPCTFGLVPTILQAIPDANIVLVRILDDNYSENPGGFATGELSIEAIVRKPIKTVCVSPTASPIYSCEPSS